MHRTKRPTVWLTAKTGTWQQTKFQTETVLAIETLLTLPGFVENIYWRYGLYFVIRFVDQRSKNCSFNP
jgi:hypothetical protein